MVPQSALDSRTSRAHQLAGPCSSMALPLCCAQFRQLLIAQTLASNPALDRCSCTSERYRAGLEGSGSRRSVWQSWHADRHRATL